MLSRDEIIEMIASEQQIKENKDFAIMVYHKFSNDKLIEIFNKESKYTKLQFYNNCFNMEFKELTEKYCNEINTKNDVPENKLTKADLKYRITHGLDI